MNHLISLTGLRNRYFGIRHGQAESNTLHIVIGDPRVGVKAYGLTSIGKQQVRYSIPQCLDLDDSCLIYSSDFLRAKETAEITGELIGVDQIFLEAALRERFFGRFEGTSSAAYDFVHAAENPEFYSENGVESLESVLDRTTRLVKRLEEDHSGRKIILVSHGDPLFCLEAGFRKAYPIHNNGYFIMGNAEIKEFKLVQ